MFRSAFRARIDRYFALPPEQRQAEIDRQIAEEEMWRKAFEAGRALSMPSEAGPVRGQTRPLPAVRQTPDQTGGRPPGPGVLLDESHRGRAKPVAEGRWSIGRPPRNGRRYTEWRRATDARREQLGLPARGSR